MAIYDYPYSSCELTASKLAQTVSEHLSACIERKGKAYLALSGGQTPVLFFQQLANINIAWEHVVITLVDERWSEDTQVQNETLVRTHLLQNYGAKAGFVPLKTEHDDIENGYMSAENRLHEQLADLDFAVFGLGDDGHTASWFPHSSALSEALSEDNRAWSSMVKDAPVFAQRLTLNWRLLSRCQRFFLHFHGAQKYHVYQQALAHLEQVAAMPIRKILQQEQIPISLYRSE